MASDREIEAIRKDPERWRLLVRQLLRYDEHLFEPKDIGYLDSLAVRDWQEELSYRQAEWLLDIRDSVQVVTTFRDFSVPILIRRCYENRLEFDLDEDRAWVADVHASGRTSLRRSEAARLYRLAKGIGEVDDWAA